MPDNTNLPNDIGVEAKITNAGLSVQVKSRALAMVDALLRGLGLGRLAKLLNEDFMDGARLVIDEPTVLTQVVSHLNELSWCRRGRLRTP